MDKRIYLPVIGISGLALVIAAIFAGLNSVFGCIAAPIGASLLLLLLAMMLWKRFLLISSVILGGAVFFFSLVAIPWVLSLFNVFD